MVLVFFCCFVFLQYMPTIFVHCLNSRMVRWLKKNVTRTRIQEVISNKWVNYNFWVSYPFNNLIPRGCIRLVFVSL